MEKQCRKCGLTRPIEEFYWKCRSRQHLGDGHSAVCKDCMRQHRRTPEAMTLANAAWARRYATEEGRKKILDKHKRQRQTERYKASHKVRNAKYLRTEKGRQGSRERQRRYHKLQWYKDAIDRYRIDNPEKRDAWVAVSNAVANGYLVRPSACSICGCPCTPDAHHEDYSKPLDVVWMCHQCHVDYHMSVKK